MVCVFNEPPLSMWIYILGFNILRIFHYIFIYKDTGLPSVYKEPISFLIEILFFFNEI